MPAFRAILEPDPGLRGIFIQPEPVRVDADNPQRALAKIKARTSHSIARLDLLEANGRRFKSYAVLGDDSVEEIGSELGAWKRSPATRGFAITLGIVMLLLILLTAINGAGG